MNTGTKFNLGKLNKVTCVTFLGQIHEHCITDQDYGIIHQNQLTFIITKFCKSPIKVNYFAQSENNVQKYTDQKTTS